MKLLSFDIDGTLMPVGDKEIPQKIIDRINQMVDLGYLVVFNSGRPYDALKRLVARIKPGNVYLGVCNGAAIFDLNGNMLFSKPVSNDYLRESYLNNPSYAVYSYTTDNKILFYEDSPLIVHESIANGQDLYKIYKEKDYDEFVSLKILFSANLDVINSTKIKYDDTKYSLIRTNVTMFELMDKSVDKDSAIIFFQNKFGIDKKDIYAFGDADNDLLSIKNYNGATYLKGSEACRKAAKYISTKAPDEWVLDALDYFQV
ncbi:MAG: Cof-type HAD-IIB family hydrolase [Clostridia bacterium]|nr:Cof-type HAD-IIB family hydrolase [Clostridia bacterium]